MRSSDEEISDVDTDDQKAGGSRLQEDTPIKTNRKRGEAGKRKHRKSKYQQIYNWLKRGKDNITREVLPVEYKLSQKYPQ